MLGADSFSIIREVESHGKYPSGKTVFWYYFVKILYQPFGLVEIPIGVQLLLSSLIFSRILAWCWNNKLQKTFFFLLVFVALAPHMMTFIATLYPDGVFAVAVAGLLFELWLITSNKKASRTSLFMLAITVPFALFFRSNGTVFLVFIIAAATQTYKADRRWILAISLSWCAVAVLGSQFHKSIEHGSLYPLALYETVNFLQPRPMNLQRDKPRVSEESIRIITRNQPLEKVISSYDRDYWDPLVHNPDGPNFFVMEKKDQKKLIKEFFRYNLWQNVPAFISSRTNIFFVSAFAEGGLPNLTYSQYLIPQTKTESAYRKFHLEKLEKNFTKFYEWGKSYRWIFWSPFLGIALLFIVLRIGIVEKSAGILLVTSSMLVQLGAIIFFSPAGEYRYLLLFFTLPMVLLPILAIHRGRNSAPPAA